MRRLLVLGALLWASPARADAGAIVYARFNAVYAQAPDGSGAPLWLGELPDDAKEVSFIEANQDGSLIVMDFGTYSAWLHFEKGAAGDIRGSRCTGRARPEPLGICLVCPTPDGPILVSSTKNATAPLPRGLRETVFLGPSGFDMAALSKEGVIGFDRRKPEETRLLAKPGLDSHFLAAPDGKRAVAIYGEKQTSRIRSFLLDGEGVSRQLGGPGVPLAWSWDSTWVLIQEGILPAQPGEPDEEGLEDEPYGQPFELAAPAQKKPRKRPRRPPPPAAPTTRACVARAVGGEVKCWDDYSGLAFSPDSTQVLLKKGMSIYVGQIAGVRPVPPVKILDGVDGAATWLPIMPSPPPTTAPTVGVK